MTPDRPCRPERVLRYVFGPCSDEERAETEDHVANCSDCRSDLDAVLRVGVGRDWRGYESLSAPVDDIIAKVRATDAGSRSQAMRDLATLKACSRDERSAVVFRGGVVISPALAWAMTEEGDRIYLSAPRETLAWFDLACLVSDAAARSGTLLAHELRVETWKNYSWLLSYLGDYALAEQALDWAEDAADQCADRRHMVTIVQLARGISLGLMQRFSEALPIVVHARQTFADLGDDDRYIKAIETEANIRMKSGDAGGAVALLSGIVELDGDELTRARRYGNIATALEIVGALWSAGEFLSKAKAIYVKVGATNFLQHNTWVLARILASAKRIDESVAHFEEASAGFRALGSIDHAIRVDIEWCEVEIDHDMATAETYDRLRHAATYAIEKGLPIAKCRALEYLQQLGRQATVSHVRYVRDFLQHFDVNPHLQFSPPEMSRDLG